MRRPRWGKVRHALVGGDGRLLWRRADLSTSAAESWTLAGVSEATSCAVAVLPTGTLVAAVNTDDEVLVAQADIAGLL